jgi:hypothetical protein
MKGLTWGRTWAIDMPTANAPSGSEPLKPLPISWFSAAAWRASTEWIESAAARTSLFLILPACPR